LPTTGCGNAIDTSTEHLQGNYGNSFQSPASIQDNATFATGGWYNVIYTYGGNVAKLYVNGTLVDSSVVNSPAAFTTQDLFIGKHGDPVYPYYVNGVIDEVRIYNRVICAGEVATLNNLKR
jgi:hypothetical protein